MSMFNKMFYSKNKSEGFSLPEILVVVAIIGILAAIAVPVSMSQQSKAYEASIKSDLTSAAAVIENQLINWRGAPPGDLNICHSSPVYPSATVAPTNTCNELEWKATLQSNGNATSPPLQGKVSPGVVVQGRIASDGSYCLDGSSTRNGTGEFHFDSGTSQVANGSCKDIEWIPTGGLVGSTGATTTPGDLPPPPSGVAVEVPEGGSTATVKWNAQAGVTYIIKVTNEPAKTFAASTAGVMSCVFPAETCEGPATGSLMIGTYTAIVRAGNSEGWGAGATQDFKIETSAAGGFSRVPAPDQPTVSQSGADINVSWAAPTGLPDGEQIINYRISWSADNVEWTDAVETNSSKQNYKLLGASFVSGTTYYFRVQAMSDSGILGRPSPSSVALEYTVSKPAPPALLYAVPGLNKVDLFWTGSSENTYVVSLRPDAGAVGNPFCTSDTTSNCSVTATSLMNEMPYIFTVRTKDPQGVLSDAATVTGTPTASMPPSVPLTPTAEAGPGGGQISLTWKPPISTGGTTVNQYQIQWATTNDESSWNEQNSVILEERNITFDNGNYTYSYTRSNLVPSTRYFFRIAAINNQGFGAYSTVVSAVPFTAAPSVTATAYDTNVLLTWFRLVGDDEGYNIYINGSSTPIANVPAGSTYYRATGLTNGTTYSFVVRSVNSEDVLSPSSISRTATPVKTASGGTESNIVVAGTPYRVHQFTSVGTSTFSVHNTGRVVPVDYLIIGGGGAGSGSTSGGGGAGGYRDGEMNVSAQNYSVVVGGGGGVVGTERAGSNGANSSFAGIIATGGGRGAGSAGGTSHWGPGNGGSGGGGQSYYGSSGGGTGISGQGFAGAPPSNSNTPGGGGGAGGPGSTNGTGGPGKTSSITGTAVTRGGGGGGGTRVANNGGVGGGGAGTIDGSSNATSGTPNTGGGGGGGWNYCCGNSGGGGSGIVIIRYKIFPIDW